MDRRGVWARCGNCAMFGHDKRVCTNGFLTDEIKLLRQEGALREQAELKAAAELAAQQNSGLKGEELDNEIRKMAKEKLTAKIMADRKAGNVPNPDNNRYGHGGHGRGAGSAQHGDDCGKCINCLDKKRVRDVTEGLSGKVCISANATYQLPNLCMC